MIKKNQKLLNLLKAGLDFIIVTLVYSISAYVYLYTQQTLFSNIASNIYISVLYSAITIILYKLFSLYETHRLLSLRKELTLIFNANTVAVLLFAALLFIFRLEEFSRGALILSYIILNIVFAAERFTLKKMLRNYRKKGYNLKHVVVVGGGKLAQRYINNIKQHKEYGFNCIGYVSLKNTVTGAQYLSNYNNFEQILSEKYIDEVIIALDIEDIGNMEDVISICEKHGTKVQIIPFYNDYIPTVPAIDIIGDIKLINMRTIPLDNVVNAMIKRAVDIFVSLIFITVFSPIMLIAFVGTKLTIKGPAIFMQERVGRNKKIFTMYKFRSMRITGTEETGWSKNDDNRKTNFGSFLRKTSIDEFPQFFNVLKGDMSLIGPRPEVPFHVEHFKEEIPLYMVKHQVKPGITGWAQVNGFRGDTSIEGRIKCDIWYIENWSIWLDIKIIFMTAFGGMLNKEKLLTKGSDENAN